ncbi:hypothetical protein EWM64_g3780 [Hericium alpestre]|uniref:Uncharacterized protein n=1 Tax=Hericium alpestre TaxID=135208 RepID=A0A4Z0A1P8_9AGAM|nr:hypothetical protein EWM64_g3780 [Hericium alpestre]
MSDKSTTEIIRTFHEQVNLTADELEKWLDNPNSRKAGTGVGHDSGRRIVQILRKNPKKDEAKYDEDDIAHMRKVVAYNGRHLAQEDHLKDTKTIEELEKAKSTISLRNWGHDPVKVKKEEDSPGKASIVQKGKKQPGAETGAKRKRDEEEEEEEEEESSVERTLREGDTANGKATGRNKRRAAPKGRNETQEGVDPGQFDAKQA